MQPIPPIKGTVRFTPLNWGWICGRWNDLLRRFRFRPRTVGDSQMVLFFLVRLGGGCMVFSQQKSSNVGRVIYKTTSGKHSTYMVIYLYTRVYTCIYIYILFWTIFFPPKKHIQHHEKSMHFNIRFCSTPRPWGLPRKNHQGWAASWSFVWTVPATKLLIKSWGRKFPFWDAVFDGWLVGWWVVREFNIHSTTMCTTCCVTMAPTGPLDQHTNTPCTWVKQQLLSEQCNNRVGNTCHFIW